MKLEFFFLYLIDDHWSAVRRLTFDRSLTFSFRSDTSISIVLLGFLWVFQWLRIHLQSLDEDRPSSFYEEENYPESSNDLLIVNLLRLFHSESTIIPLESIFFNIQYQKKVWSNRWRDQDIIWFDQGNFLIDSGPIVNR